jgi:hypothetical protein
MSADAIHRSLEIAAERGGDIAPAIYELPTSRAARNPVS